MVFVHYLRILLGVAFRPSSIGTVSDAVFSERHRGRRSAEWCPKSQQLARHFSFVSRLSAIGPSRLVDPFGIIRVRMIKIAKAVEKSGDGGKSGALMVDWTVET
jgi:hypothetical protein